MNIVNITLLGRNCSVIKQADISIDRDGDTFASGIVTNVDKPTEDLGTTVNIYDREAGGFSQFTYLKFVKGTVDATFIGQMCGTVRGKDYEVTPDGETINTGALPAVALAAMDDGKFGWFWTGGICPIGLVPGLSDKNVTVTLSVDPGDSIQLHGLTNEVAISNASMTDKPVIGYAKVES